jgi:hypothetical protein
MEEKVILSAQVATVQRDQLARLAAANERSLSGEVRRAVDTYLRLSEPYQDPGAASAPPLGRLETDERRGLVGPAAARGEDAA